MIKPTSKARRVLAALLTPLSRILDRLYRSEYNPLYRSGTLAVGMLLILLVTGLYLIFFYSISSPYESIQRIHSQVLLGRWIRTVHRYATDAAIVAVAFHFLQILIQGRSWGPRILAWISGLVLLGALFLSTWTGYVMTWDRHGQWIAESGARMAATIPFMRDTIIRTFGGLDPMTGSFFFMNLFLHIAIPLAMVIGIWVHTAHLSKPKWLPRKQTYIPLICALIFISVIRSAPVLEKADLLRLTGRMPTDLFAGFWLPMTDTPGQAFTWGAVITGLLLALLIIPWLWQGNRKSGPAEVLRDDCVGCTKCSRECPFEAITMEARDDGSKHPVAVVSKNRCVECGICVASCYYHAIALPGFSQKIQAQEIEKLIAFYPEHKGSPILVYCKTNAGVQRSLEKIKESQDIVSYGVSCAGVLHAATAGRLLDHFSEVILLTCPEENCSNRWGHSLSMERMTDSGTPAFLTKDGQPRVRVVALAGSSQNLIEKILSGSAPGPAQPRRRSYMRTAVAHTVVVAAIAFFSARALGTDPENGVVRIFLTLPGYIKTTQQEWTEEELKGTLDHMHLPQKIIRTPIHYDMELSIDGKTQPVQQLKPRRDGQQVRFSMEQRLAPGNHHILLRLKTDIGNPEQTVLDREINLSAGQAVVLEHNGGK